MVCSDICSLCTTRSHISYTAHAHKARAFFVFLNCTKESPAHAIVPMRTSPPATYTSACPRAPRLTRLRPHLQSRTPSRPAPCFSTMFVNR